MVKSRRLSPASASSPSPICSSSSPSPAASLSLISNPPLNKPTTAACTPFISSLKRCPLLEVNAELSALTLAEGRDHVDSSCRRIRVRDEPDNGELLSQVSVDAGDDRCSRARLQHHWIQVGGKVMIPDTWGWERHLQEWVNFGLVEDAFRPAGLMSARSALVADCQRRSRGSMSSSQQTTITSSADPVQVSSCG